MKIVWGRSLSIAYSEHKYIWSSESVCVVYSPSLGSYCNTYTYLHNYSWFEQHVYLWTYIKGLHAFKWPAPGICTRDVCLVVVVNFSELYLIIEMRKFWNFGDFAHSNANLKIGSITTTNLHKILPKFKIFPLFSITRCNFQIPTTTN